MRVTATFRSPSSINIVAKTDEHDSLPPLRYAKIGRVEEFGYDLVVEARSRLRGMMLLQSAKVFLPSFFLPCDQLRVLQLKLNVREIVVEAGTGKALHVLENERPRPSLSHCADGLWEHVPRIVVSPMTTAEGERLARWSTGDEVDALINGEINFANITLDDVPISPVFRQIGVVLAESIAAPFVELHNGTRFEPRSGEPYSKTTSPCEKL